MGCPWLPMAHLWVLFDPKQGSFAGKRRAHAQERLWTKRTCCSQCCPLDLAAGQAGVMSPLPRVHGARQQQDRGVKHWAVCAYGRVQAFCFGDVLVHGGEPQR